MAFVSRVFYDLGVSVFYVSRPDSIFVNVVKSGLHDLHGRIFASLVKENGAKPNQKFFLLESDVTHTGLSLNKSEYYDKASDTFRPREYSIYTDPNTDLILNLGVSNHTMALAYYDSHTPKSLLDRLQHDTTCFGHGVFTVPYRPDYRGLVPSSTMKALAKYLDEILALER